MYRLENDAIVIEVAEKGAELVRLYGKRNNREYLHDGDPRYWSRRSPVLFPIVGSVRHGEYRVDGKSYLLSQHGFARDLPFALIKQDDTQLWMELTSTEETRERYPYDFVLRCGFRLEGNALRVLWEVENPADTGMYFSIGAHPAFLCHLSAEGSPEDDRIHVGDDLTGEFTYYLIGEEAMAAPDKTYRMKADFPAVAKTFAGDALIVPGEHIHRLALADKDGGEYVVMTFDVPLFGIWTPVKPEVGPAPFICLEPWYGRCDREGFAGDISERDHIEYLEGHAVFCADYTVTLPLEA